MSGLSCLCSRYWESCCCHVPAVPLIISSSLSSLSSSKRFLLMISFSPDNLLNQRKYLGNPA